MFIAGLFCGQEIVWWNCKILRRPLSNMHILVPNLIALALVPYVHLTPELNPVPYLFNHPFNHSTINEFNFDVQLTYCSTILTDTIDSM